MSAFLNLQNLDYYLVDYATYLAWYS